MAARYRYETTRGMSRYHCDNEGDDEAPSPPSDEAWELVCAVVQGESFVWFWRLNSEDSNPSRNSLRPVSEVFEVWNGDRLVAKYATQEEACAHAGHMRENLRMTRMPCNVYVLVRLENGESKP